MDTENPRVGDSFRLATDYGRLDCVVVGITNGMFDVDRILRKEEDCPVQFRFVREEFEMMRKIGFLT